MMSHDAYRRAMLADPHSGSPELAVHRDGCAECRAFTDRLLRFETRLRRALEIEAKAPTGASNVLPFARRRKPRPRRWLALAASVAVAVVVAGGFWLVAPSATLAADVTAHMAGEPSAWRVTQTAVPGEELAAVLSNAGMHLSPNAGVVSYASSCAFRGHTVPHLVVQSPDGPVTVMVLIHETAPRRRDFDEQGYRGTIVPVAGHGSIAVLMKDAGIPARDVDAIAARLRAAIVWNP